MCDENRTEAQRELFDRNPHLVPVERLGDGDWLALDAGAVGADGEPMGPYVVTLDGKVQGMAYHYRYYHGLEVPAEGQESPPSETGPAHLATGRRVLLPTALLTTAEVAERFGVDDSTVRRWCEAGRLPNALPGGRTGTGAAWLIPETDLDGFERPKPGWPEGRPRGEVGE